MDGTSIWSLLSMTASSTFARAALGLSLLLPGTVLALSPVVSANVAFAAAPPGPDEPLSLKALKITGNDRVPTADINAVVPFHVGDTVTQKQIAAGLQDVMGVYKEKNVGASFGQKTKFIGKNVEVEWTITEQAPSAAAALVVDGIVFSGNKAVSADALTAATKLRPGSPVTNEAVKADQTAIQELYKSKQISAGVGMSPASPSPGHVILTWNITEQGH